MRAHYQLKQILMSHLWDETIDEQGNSSLKTHELKTISVGCEEGKHHFVFSGGSLREAVCNKCQTTVPFVLGFHKIENGSVKNA